MATLVAPLTTRSATCPRCRGGREVYLYLHNQYEFDVDRAREITNFCNP